MAEKKTTQKDLYNRIKAVMADDPEVVEFCDKKLAQLEKAATRERKPRVNQEVVNFREDVFNALANLGEPQTNKEMAARFDVTSQKMSHALNFLVKEGRVERIENPEKKSAPAQFAVIFDEDVQDFE